MKKRLHLFEGYGVELELMIVDNNTLNVRPIADVLLRNEAGEVEGEVEHGLTAWSNELVSHVVEIKSNGPQADLIYLRDKFVSDVRQINQQLEAQNAQLLATAAHPWMNPGKETKLYEYENLEIYQAYDRIFNCKGHGWSNLQSTHINLPFYDDEEFARLHTAIRFLMPMIPALTASSPILDGKFTGYMDKRLYYYEKNQSSLPILTGRVVPEKLFTKHQYQKHVYDRIAASIAPFDPDGILKPVWLNSRGAMARFDRGAVEIRILDIQECVSADLAVVALITEAVKLLVKEKLVTFKIQESFDTELLYQVLKSCVKTGSEVIVTDTDYLSSWGYNAPVSGKQFWQDLIAKVNGVSPDVLSPWTSTLDQLTSQGTLAERIVSSLNGDFSKENLHATYSKLSACLQQDQLFVS